MNPTSEAQQVPINGLSHAPEWAGTSVHIACQPVRNCDSELYPQELPAIVTAAPLRRRTFASGRQCARAALNQAGLPAVALPRGEDGSVIWPDDVIGSISHTNYWAIAAIAVPAMCDAASLGIDLESIQPLEEGVLDLVATANERAELEAGGRKNWQATALFSLKESIYKCLRPLHGQFIGFQEVEILDIRSGRPHISFCNDALSKRFRASDVQLRMAITPSHICSLAWLKSHG